MDNTAQQPDVDDTNLSGMSDNLENFLKTWAEDEVDPQDTAKMLHSSEGAQYQGWLPQELLAAYNGNVLTPEFLSMACNRTFDNQRDVGDWLKSVWQMWFDQPFPTQQPPQTEQAA